MNLYIYTGATDLTEAAVTAANNLTAVTEFPALVYGDTEPLAIRFTTDASGTQPSWANVTGNSIDVTVGELGSTGAERYAATSDFTYANNTYTGEIFLGTADFATWVGSRRNGKGWLDMQIRHTDPDGAIETLAVLTMPAWGSVPGGFAGETIPGPSVSDTVRAASVLVSGDSAFGGTTPLQRVHIKSNSATLPGLVAGNMMHDYYGLVVESEDAVLGLASRNEGGHGSGIDMMEVNSGVLADKWYFGRLSSGFNSSVYWAYGTVADYTALTDYMLLTKAGGMSLPQVGSTLSVGTSTVNGTLTLHGSGTESILLTTSDGSDTHRLAIGGGGSNSATRGAYINLHGNEYSGAAGDLAIIAGDSGVSGQGRIRFFTGTLVERAAFDKDGDLDILTATEATTAGNGSLTTAGGIYAAKKIVTSGDLEVSDIGEGVVIKSPNGTRWRITVSDAGAVVVGAA